MRDGWVETTLAKITTTSLGGVWGKDPGGADVDVPVYRQTEFKDDGSLTIPADATRSLTKREFASRILQRGDVLIQKSAGSAHLPGRVVRVVELPEPSAFSNFLNLLRCDQELVLPDYYFIVLQALHAQGVAHSHQRGTNIRNLNLPEYLGTSILLPPLAEQRRIVDLIAAVDENIAAADTLAKSAQAARSSLLSELLGAGGEDWVETTLGEVATIEMGQSPPGHTYNTSGEGLPFIQGSAEFGERHPAPVKWCSQPKKVAEAGDLLLSVRAPVGDLNYAAARIAIGRGLARLQGTDSASVEFLGLAIQHALPDLQRRSGGGMFDSITKAGLAGLILALPPLVGQQRIVDLIAAVDENIATAQSLAAVCREVRSALLTDLLSGDHEIPTSYDALLEAS